MNRTEAETQLREVFSSIEKNRDSLATLAVNSTPADVVIAVAYLLAAVQVQAPNPQEVIDAFEELNSFFQNAYKSLVEEALRQNGLKPGAEEGFVFVLPHPNFTPVDSPAAGTINQVKEAILKSKLIN